jgi:DNA (cytosine-5)-methyltransferase 1
MARPYKLIDLFSGAGGMTYGFVQAGFAPMLAVEKERDFAASYRCNFGSHVMACDVADIVDAGGIKSPADIVIGGPPCQGFSNLTGNKESDPRRAMWRFFMYVVESTNCKVFVVENVRNLVKAPEGYGIIEKGRQLGYEMSWGIVDMSRFGVPQLRKRAIIIGSRIGKIELPTPTNETMTVREALKGIPRKPTKTQLEVNPATGPDLHIARNPTPTSLRRYKLIPPGGNRFDLQRLAPEITPGCWIRKTDGGTDLFGRLEWDKPARCTIRCEFYKPEKGRYLHPSEHRPITHWEAARLQNFPDDFKWCGTKIRIAIQIGNAVPPKFSCVLGKHIMERMQSFGASPVKGSKRFPLQPLLFPSAQLV